MPIYYYGTVLEGYVLVKYTVKRKNGVCSMISIYVCGILKAEMYFFSSFFFLPPSTF